MNIEIEKHRLNAPGKYYADWNCCLAHELCIYYAPKNFQIDDGAYIVKQPTTPEEEAQCRQAMQDCPVGAIHDDGEI